MPVKIKINPGNVSAHVMGAWNKGLYILSNEILADCNEYCKEDRQTLIKSSYIHSRRSEGKLIWQTAYARRQYWGIRTSLTPGRTWKWCETAKRKHLKEWQRLAQRVVNDNL